MNKFTQGLVNYRVYLNPFHISNYVDVIAKYYGEDDSAYGGWINFHQGDGTIIDSFKRDVVTRIQDLDVSK